MSILEARERAERRASRMATGPLADLRQEIACWRAHGRTARELARMAGVREGAISALVHGYLGTRSKHVARLREFFQKLKKGR